MADTKNGENPNNGTTSRVAADRAAARAERNARREKEALKILACDPEDSVGIFGVATTDAQEEWNKKFWELGAMLHKTQCTTLTAESQKTVAEAYKVFLKAAEGKVHQDYIDQLENWDGKRKFEDEDGSASEAESEENEDRPPDDEITPPPETVVALYKEATKYIQQMYKSPDSAEAEKGLTDINAKIDKAAAEADVMGDVCSWHIDHLWWRPHYLELLKSRNPEANKLDKSMAESNKKIEEALIRLYVKRNHLPAGWAKFPPQQSETSPAPPENKLHYPWTTKGITGGTILGYLGAGRGYRVCVEKNIKGNIIRLLEPGSETGINVKKDYVDIGGLHLPSAQKLWSYKDRDDFVKLHWVTRALGKNGNSSGRTPSPAAYCCVEFKNKAQAINLLNVSTLEKVLGRSVATVKINEVCENDGILPPNKAGYESYGTNPIALEKDPEKREEMRQKLLDERRANPENGGKKGDPPAKSSNGGAKGGSTASGDMDAKFADLAEEMRAAVKHINEKVDKVETQTMTFQDQFSRFMVMWEKQNGAKTATAASGAAS